MIISATRRTDIPSLYGEWFVNRLKEGYVLVQNPYNPNRYTKVDLSLDAVDIIAFWTKNPIPFLRYLPQIDEMGYQYFFQFTLTSYGRECEKNLPSKDKLMSAFIAMSEKIGKKRMVWRYDPIIINDVYTLQYHAEKFSYMAKILSKSANRCVISFLDEYKSLSVRMGEGYAAQMTSDNILAVSKILSDIAKENGMQIYTCAEKYDLSQFGINHGACIDKAMIEEILGATINVKRDKNQREECLCIESAEIGTYNCCANGCVYCYAVNSEKTASSNIKRHNKTSPVLIGEVNKKAIITNKCGKSIIENQISLF